MQREQSCIFVFSRCVGGRGGGVKELHEESGRTGQPPLYCYWESQGDRPDRHCHESSHPAQSQTQRHGINLSLLLCSLTWTSVDRTCFLLRYVCCELQVSGAGKVNEEMTATVDFRNPFTFALEDVYIRMEGPGIMLPKSKFYRWPLSFTPLIC